MFGPSVMQASSGRTDDGVRRMAGDQGRNWSENDFCWANHQETYYAMDPMQANMFPRSMTLRVNSDVRQLMLHDLQQREARYMPG